MKYQFLVSMLLATLLWGCAEQDQSKYQKRANLDAQEAVKEEQSAQDRRSLQMEEDLTRLHNLYDAISGEYQGVMKSDQYEFLVRFEIKPTLSRYQGSRIRQPSEVESDLLNLKLVVYETTTALNNSGSVYGCNYLEVKPIVAKGEIYLTTQSCQRNFEIKFSDGTNELQASQLALMAQNGEIKTIPYFDVIQRSVFNASPKSFRVTATQAEAATQIEATAP